MPLFLSSILFLFTLQLYFNCKNAFLFSSSSIYYYLSVLVCLVFLLFLNNACFSLFPFPLTGPSQFYFDLFIYLFTYTVSPYIHIQVYIHIWAIILWALSLSCEYKIYSRAQQFIYYVTRISRFC